MSGFRSELAGPLAAVIIESAVDAIIVIDAQGLIEVFNPAAQRLFGYADSEVIGRNVSMLMPAPYRDEHDAYLKRYLSGGDARVIGVGREVQGLTRDGRLFPAHLSVGEMLVGGQRKFTGILHDLSERKRIEQQLSEQQSLAKIGEMAAVLAHVIRNPLAGIRGAIQVLAARYDAASKEGMVSKEIIARVDTLTELMQDLLLYARPPKPRPTAVDLEALVSAIVELLARDPDVSGVRIAVTGSAPIVCADPELLKIVFQNLLINGAHAMSGRGDLHVQLGASDRLGSVAFTDRGPGIPTDIRDKVFTPFFTTKVRGTGLGLSTARRLVEAQGGTIGIECPPEGGTTVTVLLPVLTP
jgi:two-component system sensor kinase FixL